MTRDEIVSQIEDMGLVDEEIILFDGMENAFLGVAERFEPLTREMIHADGGHTIKEVGGTHRYFAVYSYSKMVEILVADGSDYDDAVEYLEFNTVGLFAGPTTPAILRD